MKETYEPRWDALRSALNDADELHDMAKREADDDRNRAVTAAWAQYESATAGDEPPAVKSVTETTGYATIDAALNAGWTAGSRPAAPAREIYSRIEPETFMESWGWPIIIVLVTPVIVYALIYLGVLS